jgi:hypothetical protein
VLEDAEGKLSFLVHPQLHKIVSGSDLSYIGSLLRDFAELRQTASGGFIQAAFLTRSRPLGIQEVGSSISDHSASLASILFT